MVTVKLQVPLLLAASVAITCTVVVPTLKLLPDGVTANSNGLAVQLSDAGGMV